MLKYKRRIRTYGIVLILIMLVACVIAWRQIFFCRDLSCLKSDYFSGFVKTSVFQGESDGYVYMKGDQRIHLRTLHIDSKEKAQEYMRVYRADINGMYDTLRAPYPGQISQTVVCDQRYRPTISEDAGIQSMAIHGIMSKNGSFGVCGRDEAGYEGLLQMIYCGRQKTLFVAELRRPYTDILSLPDSLNIRCR